MQICSFYSINNFIQIHPYLNEEAERCVRRLIACVFLLNIVLSDAGIDYTDLNLIDSQIYNAQDQVQGIWTKELVAEILSQKIIYCASIINNQKQYTDQWDLRKELGLVKIYAESEFVGPMLSGCIDNQRNVNIDL